MSSSSEATPNPTAGAAKAVVKILLTLAVLGGMYFAYSGYVENSKKIKELSKKAFDLLQHDDLADYQKAKKLLDEALAIRGKDPFVVTARAEVGALLAAEHGLSEDLARTKELLVVADQNAYNLAERFSAEGLTLIADGKFDDAEKKMMVIVDKGGATAKIIAAIGHSRVRQGRLDIAKNDFKQAADRDWRSPRFSSLYGEAFFDGGDFLSAQGMFQKALDSAPGHARSIIGKARADVGRNERVEEAKKALDEVLLREDALSPVLKARALAGKAEALYASGDFVGAEEAAKASIAIDAKADPGRGYANYTLGLALAAQQKDGALDAFKAAIAAFPVIARFYFQGALALARAQKPAEGEALFAEYEKSLKKSDQFHIARGDFFRTKGDLDGAIASYEAAIKENEVNPEGFYKKGLALQEKLPSVKAPADKKKLADEMIDLYNKAVGIRGKYPEVYRQIGLMHLDLKPTSSEALENFLKALTFYKEQKAPRKVFEEFISEVEQRYLKAKLKVNAAQWVKEATAFSK